MANYSASMGPRLCSRGNSLGADGAIFEIAKLQWGHDFAAVEMSVKLNHIFTSKDLKSGLQWGHDFAAVEIYQAGNEDLDTVMLQWGHDFAAVEIFLVRLSVKRLLSASMGPRLCSRGNCGLFSAFIGVEKWAVFERFGKYAVILLCVPTSSREYSQYEDASSASRPSRNHITSRKMGLIN